MKAAALALLCVCGALFIAVAVQALSTGVARSVTGPTRSAQFTAPHHPTDPPAARRTAP